MFSFRRFFLFVSSAVLILMVLTQVRIAKAEETISTENSPEILTSEKSTDTLNKINQYVQESGETSVNSVSELSDVQPNDWAFQALQSLVERYGCIAGYPNSTFKGNRAMTRYEFAAGLNTCLDKVNQLLSAGTANLISKDDLVTLLHLQEQFATELTTLRGRVDALEMRTAEVEGNQFSTTTKLTGQVIFALTDAFGDASVRTRGSQDNYNTTFSNRVRLKLETSFTGKDKLITQIQASNITSPRPTTGTAPGNEARLSFDSASLPDNGALLNWLQYSFPVNDNVQLTIGTGASFAFNDIVDIVNPLTREASGTISRFGRYNPIYRLGGDTGGGVNIQLNRNIKVDLGYTAGNANNPGVTPGIAGGGENGLFSSNYAALAQVVYSPSNSSKIAFTYVNAYNNNGLGHGTGSLASNLGGRRVSSNSYGIEANFRVSKGFDLGGWVGYTDARVLTGVRGDADIWNWAITLGFPDLGKKGNLGGVIVGMQPKLTGTSTLLPELPRRDRSSGLHIEAFYRYRINDHIDITPGFIWLTAPNHDNSNGDIILGVVRTTFTF
jgi:Carbohydrate-selective porin, OprB family/S-layer homology domain